MGQIRKKETYGIIDTEEENEAISYCQRCLKFNVYSILQERVYLPGEVTIEHERENRKQCHNCCQIVPIYEVKKESKLQDFVELSNFVELSAIHLSRVSLYLDWVTGSQNPLMKGKDRNY
jgi:hypothetical protein